HLLRPVTTLALVALFVPLAALAQDEATTTAVAEAATGIVPLLMRWLHVFGAIFLLGGAFYLRTVLMPAAAENLEGESAQKLRQGVMARWRKILPILMLVLIVSGFYNYLAVTRFAHEGQGQYHMLFGIKFLLAFAVFMLASMLSGKKAIAQKLQQNAGLWLGITIAMGVAIVMIAGYMKLM
ncbi:MAG: hypothetical protein L3K26_18770, partial [Candidatus Hydrogenedentes bacterium]|nr:hypothetical protein [Candidatus Hydrogenedentota bacterium]